MSEKKIVITVKLIITTQTILVSHGPEEMADYCCDLLYGGNGPFWKGGWGFLGGWGFSRVGGALGVVQMQNEKLTPLW